MYVGLGALGATASRNKQDEGDRNVAVRAARAARDAAQAMQLPHVMAIVEAAAATQAAVTRAASVPRVPGGGPQAQAVAATRNIVGASTEAVASGRAATQAMQRLETETRNLSPRDLSPRTLQMFQRTVTDIRPLVQETRGTTAALRDAGSRYAAVETASERFDAAARASGAAAARGAVPNVPAGGMPSQAAAVGRIITGAAAQAAAAGRAASESGGALQTAIENLGRGRFRNPEAEASWRQWFGVGVTPAQRAASATASTLRQRADEATGRARYTTDWSRTYWVPRLRVQPFTRRLFPGGGV